VVFISIELENWTAPRMIMNFEPATTSSRNNETLDSFDGFYPSFLAAMDSPHQSKETQRELRELPDSTILSSMRPSPAHP
jgi:hypothetical protein